MADVGKPHIMFEIVGDVGDMGLVNHGCELLTAVLTGPVCILKYSVVKLLSGEGMR